MARNFQRNARQTKQLQQQDVQAVMTLMQQGKHAQAESKAKKLAKKFPSELMIFDILAKAQLAQSKYSEAVKVLEKLVQGKPDHYDGHYNLGVAYMNTGRAEQAAERFNFVVEKTAPSADAFTNLGAALYEMEKFADAAEAYKKAVELKPDYVPALRNLGASLRKMNRLEESETYLSKIPFLMPRFAAGHLSLGVTQRMLGKTDKALKCFETVLSLEPDNREAHNELGNVHYAAERYDDAARHFGRVETKLARAMVLEAKHQAGIDRDELLAGLLALNKAEQDNLRGAAFSAFASQQYDVEDSHPFAPSPLEFVSINALDDVLEAEPDFLNDLMVEAEKVAAFWENHTTRGGYQTHGNLFDEAEVFARLEDIIRKQLQRYRDERSGSDAGIIRQFPKCYDLDGWHVKLLKSGHQKPHIHSRGWVSGVFYLKVPDNMAGDEGAISFSLHGYNYRKVKEDIPQLVHKPKAGELVLFPSSLFHSTVPFESDEDRQCIAFDMIPA